MYVTIKNQNGEIVLRKRVRKGPPEQVIPMVAACHILEKQLGVLSMNWYTKEPYRLRVYLNLVKPVGRRRQRLEYVGASYNNYWEVTAE